MVIFHSYVNVYQRVVDPNVGKTIMNHPPKSPKSPISRDMFTIYHSQMVYYCFTHIIVRVSTIQGAGFRYHPQFCEYVFLGL